MSKSKQHRIWIAVTVAFLTCVGWYMTPTGKSRSEHIKYPAPPFSLMSTENKKVSLSDFKGKRVILIFWESYCAVCIKHMKEFNVAYKDMDHTKLEILGITAEQRSIDAIRKTVRKYGFTFPILKAGKDILKAYNVYFLPTVFLIDEEGDITHTYSGDAAVENIVREFKEMDNK